MTINYNDDLNKVDNDRNIDRKEKKRITNNKVPHVTSNNLATSTSSDVKKLT
jgi:hypothetical protein